mgnify:CR=1 FL=1
MKVFSLPPQEDWICDRFLNEWYQYNPDITTKNIDEADVNWILAGWQWDRIPINYLENKTTVLTIHHIVPDKFGEQENRIFLQRDRFIDWYHVPCQNTKEQIMQYTDKPIFVQPFWVNQFLWYDLGNKTELRKKHDIPIDAKVIGSFQRDTEGHDLKSPKLEKGPDRLIEIIKDLNDRGKDIFVVLSGPRRQYVINHLRMNSIPYKNFEFVEFTELNELYNCLDMYIVSSRYEGGPQSIVECGLTKTPIISTRVGLAPMFLPECDLYSCAEDYKSAWSAEKDVEFIYNRVIKYKIPDGLKPFKEFFKSIIIKGD